MDTATELERVFTSCAHDCGGKCLLVAHVQDGRVVRVTADPEALRRYHLEPCVRGLHYERRAHHPDRLQRPLIRRGPRGSADFREASWDEALGLVAERLAAIRAESGPGALLCLGRTGSLGALLHETRLVSQRFFSLFGGYLGTTGNYSFGAASPATIHTYGTEKTGNSRSDWFRSRLLLLWGWDPMVTVMGSHTAWALRECRRRGIPIVAVDPRQSATATFADRWVPIRPGSDVALLNTLAHELLRNGWQDEAFLRRHTVGYEAYAAYLLGDDDGIPKTPEWQEPITGVPAETARWLAREYGTRRPAALMPGWAPQRSRQGEQFHRATAALAALAGSVGVPGGSAAGIDRGPGPEGEAALPVPPNPYPNTIPINRWTDCVLQAPGAGYPAQPRAAYIVGGNPLGQHPDARKTARALERLDLVVVHEQFLTPTARYADVLLPATTFLERDDIQRPYDGTGCFYVYQRQAIPPQGQARNDWDVFAELAERLGFGAAYTEGHDADGWLRWIAARAGVPDYEAFRRAGLHWTAPPAADGAPDGPQPSVAFQAQVEQGLPFPTPSGKIELYSPRLAERHDRLVPPIPRYLDLPEGPTDPLRARFPLQLLSPKSKRRTNSTLDNVLGDDRVVTLHPDDAARRGLQAGQRVRVWNERGACLVPLRISANLTPGVAVLLAGAWVQWDADQNDVGGCPNTLTSDAGTAWGRSSIQQTVLVEVAAAEA
ncbi:MAG: molybdopterin-dependent oxidoreductase [Chloroflexi bacterium]|nr:molybdopterin-dependent oxidoreductase [Chloroflexota bacterium]